MPGKHRAAPSRGRVIRRSLPTVSAIAASLLLAPLVVTSPSTGHTIEGIAPSSVLTTTVVFPGELPAPGAEVKLLAQPDPIWPATPDGTVQYQREVPVITTVADRAGVVSFDIPEDPAVTTLARNQSGRLRAVLTYTAQRGTSDLPIYYKGVTPLVLTLEATGVFTVPPLLSMSRLVTLPEFDATLVQRLGEQTIADVGQLLDETDPAVAMLTSALEQEMHERGYLFANEAVAYNVEMLNGTYTWVTLSPQSLLVRESPDADVYDVVGITSGGFPMIDTTDAGDAVDDITSDTTGTQPAKQERGKWVKHHGDCYAISGPANANTKKYKRTVCYQVDNQTMDTAKGTSFWQYKEDASGTAAGVADMYRLWVHGQPYGHGTAVASTDRLPEPSETDYGPDSGCVTNTRSIYVESGAPVKAGISESWTKTECKKSWFGPVPKGDGEWAAEWKTEDPISPGQVRKISMILPVSAPTKDGSPIWNILSGQWVDV